MNPGGFEGFDRIAIDGVRARGFHGVLEHERANGQEFIVDVVLHAEIRKAGKTDDLTDTVNYAEVTAAIVEVIIGDPCNLIETVAQRIADAILGLGTGDTPVMSMVEVTVHKPHAPIPHEFSDVSVSIVRVQ